MNNTTVLFRLRILSAVIGFPCGAFIVEDHQKTVYAVRGGDRELALVYTSGADAMKAQAFCEAQGVPTSIVASIS
jgi:hypothetical protein